MPGACAGCDLIELNNMLFVSNSSLKAVQRTEFRMLFTLQRVINFVE